MKEPLEAQSYACTPCITPPTVLSQVKAERSTMPEMGFERITDMSIARLSQCSFETKGGAQ